MFTLKENDLFGLWKLNQFAVPDDRWVFFGLRGCLPIDDQDHAFAREQQLELVEPDHVHPRCTLGQWAPGKGFAVFPGSTVPHHRHVKSSVARGGRGTNQLLTGCYKDYRKGVHKHGKPTGHQAFRQDNKLPVRRTADDVDYDEDDRVEYGLPFDNLHAGWCMGVDSERFASAGCQVLVGFPKCSKRDNKPDTGPWKVFKEGAYGIDQDSFFYVLLNGRDARRVAIARNALAPRLRFGSKGDLVRAVQEKLRAKGFYEGDIDGDFGARSLRAVLDFQTAEFGPSEDDGIVGPMTASALGVAWPRTAPAVGVATPAVPRPVAAPSGNFRFEGKNAIAPDGTRFAKKFRKGVFNFGETTIRDFVCGHRNEFSNVSASLVNIMDAVSANEGKLEAINSWDNAFMTFGVFQWTLGAGTGRGELPALLARLKRDHAAVFQQYFGQHGLDVIGVRAGPPTKPGVTPTGFCTLNGNKLSSAGDKEQMRTIEWAYRFWLAGHDDIVRAVQIRQAMDRIHIFYNSPHHKIGNRTISDYITSEYGVALLLDQHVNRPGHVPKTLRTAIESTGGRKDPAEWNDNDERKVLEEYVDLRSNTSMTDSDKRAQVVADAVDDGVISDKRNSFAL